MMKMLIVLICAFAIIAADSTFAGNTSEGFKNSIFQTKNLKPIDSQSPIKIGDKAPDFTLPSIGGTQVSLGSHIGRKNVVLSFVPAAWTPVCSEQWPGYNILKDEFERLETVLLGITTDNIPTLFAWTEQMGGVWFPVLSDFWPHGAVSREYGILRSSGVSERALFLIDKRGIIRYMDIHDINERPSTEQLMKELAKLKE